jgi:hypothetical protein
MRMNDRYFPADPQWDKAGKVHDWRNHVPREVQEIWDKLEPLAKQAIYFMATEAAGREEWD